MCWSIGSKSIGGVDQCRKVIQMAPGVGEVEACSLWSDLRIKVHGARPEEGGGSTKRTLSRDDRGIFTSERHPTAPPRHPYV